MLVAQFAAAFPLLQRNSEIRPGLATLIETLCLLSNAPLIFTDASA